MLHTKAITVEPTAVQARYHAKSVVDLEVHVADDAPGGGRIYAAGHVVSRSVVLTKPAEKDKIRMGV